MKNRQSGLATVEFAIIGLLFFTVLFAVIEFGRLLFTWNTLTEATRRGARVAAVCPMNHAAIKNVTVFSSPSGGGTSPILPNFSSGNVTVEYLDKDGATTAAFANVRYVRVGINGYQHQMLLPFATLPLTARSFETTLPRDSLGVVPAVGSQCPFG